MTRTPRPDCNGCALCSPTIAAQEEAQQAAFDAQDAAEAWVDAQDENGETFATRAPLHKDTPASECPTPTACWWHGRTAEYRAAVFA